VVHALATTEQDSYSRLPAQPELGPAIDVDGLVAYLRASLRRRDGALSRYTTVTAIILVESADQEGGRVDLNVMAIRKRAGCDRRTIFRALNTLEELELVEREEVLPDFAACTHTTLTGWEGFHDCMRYRAANGIKRGCVAHNGRTVIRWRCTTVEELVARLPDERQRHRKRGAYVTPIGGVTRRGVYVTPNPGPLQITVTKSPPPLAERARGDTSENAVSAPPTRLTGAVPAFGGFAKPSPRPQTESESTEGGRARPVPPAPPTEAETAVLSDYRARFGVAPLDRDLLAVAAALARGWTRAELAEAFEGAATSTYNSAPGRSRASWILASDDRIDALRGVARWSRRGEQRTRRQHARDYPDLAPAVPAMTLEELARRTAIFADALEDGADVGEIPIISVRALVER
jgi:hypothetical protein